MYLQPPFKFPGTASAFKTLNVYVLEKTDMWHKKKSGTEGIDW